MDAMRGSHRLWIFLAAVAVARVASAQTAWKFEVASVKPARGAPGPPSSTVDPSIVSFQNTNLLNLLARASGLRTYQIQGPAWLGAERYDVTAKLPDGAPVGEVPAMLTGLLAERFQLATHRETKEENVFVLTVGKPGPKLKKTQLEIDPSNLPANLVANQVDYTRNGFRFPAVTVSMFANTLAALIGHPVLDETGIDGVYDIELDVAQSELASYRGDAIAAAHERASDPTNSLPSAIKALGLDWGTKKAPVEHLVVDRALRVPLEN